MLSHIGILGGTFDPIHLGHVYLAHKIQELCKLQKIWLIPCNQSPMRNPTIASAQDRLKMVELAIDDLANLKTDAREIQRLDVSYTINTLESLKAEYPKVIFSLILGSDAFSKFDEWKSAQQILKMVNLIIVTRNTLVPQNNAVLVKRYTKDLQQLQTKPAGLIYLADIETLPISSTEIRRLIKERGYESIKPLVAAKVWQYIQERNLYI
jgi:nicotinate-nucleotide adenylyltransferase